MPNISVCARVWVFLVRAEATLVTELNIKYFDRLFITAPTSGQLLIYDVLGCAMRSQIEQLYSHAFYILICCIAKSDSKLPIAKRVKRLLQKL